jgi:hypothetical protein
MNAATRIRVVLTAVLAAALANAATAAHAALSEYYVGVDGLANIASGTYAGLLNPNHGRLTFLFNHGDHYHGIGVHTYTGPNLGAGTAVNDTNGNNRIPEISSGQEPLLLTAGSGAYAGKLVSNPLAGVEYSHLEMRSVHTLNGNPEDTLGLFNSSGGRWNGPLWDDAGGHAHIHLELLSATAGLNVGTLGNPLALPVGGDVHVGDGDELFSFTPVLWVDSAAAPGVYTAEFRLIDEDGIVGDSGRFFLDVQVVPEPASFASIGVAVGLIAMAARRRRT